MDSAFLKKSLHKITTFFKTKDVVTFLLFLFFASILWLMHNTSTQREMRSTAVIQYVGIPQNILLKDALPLKIEYTVKDENKRLWDYFSYSFDTLTIDLSGQITPSDNKIEIEYETYLHKMIAQFSPTSKIVELSPNIFATSYVTLHTKTVPVELSNRIHLSPQHVLSDSIQIIPPTISIIGAPYTLDKIETIKLQNINETFTKSQSIRCDVVLPPGIRTATNTVSVIIPVEISTEKRISIPIKTVNTPENINIRTFPKEVDAVFNVGLSKYLQTNADDIEIVVDYNDILTNNNATQPLKVNRKSSNVNNLRFTPKSVEYTIEQTGQQ